MGGTVTGHQGLLLSLQVTCYQVRLVGRRLGRVREPLRGMALFQEVPTVCGDTSCQGAPAFPGALSSADGFLRLHRETPGVPVCWRQEVRTPPGELEGVGPQELSSSSLGGWDPGSGPRNSFSSNCTAGARGRCAHPSAVGKQGCWEKAWSQRPDEVLASLSSEWEWGWLGTGLQQRSD